MYKAHHCCVGWGDERPEEQDIPWAVRDREIFISWARGRQEKKMGITAIEGGRQTCKHDISTNRVVPGPAVDAVCEPDQTNCSHDGKGGKAGTRWGGILHGQKDTDGVDPDGAPSPEKCVYVSDK